ncbi:MAG: phytoene desaturase family protein [Pseudomonadota bacterium]
MAKDLSTPAVLSGPGLSTTGFVDDPRPHAAVIGAGLGGLAAAMRLGAKGYRVTIFDKLDMPGGRGSAIWKDGHRFDLGPTIVTVPQVFRKLWADCGRDFDADVDLRALDPFYEIRWPDGSSFTMSADEGAVRSEIARLSPADEPGYERFLADAERRYSFGFEGLGRRSMHQLWELIKVLPRFAWLRADRSVYAHAARRFRDERLRMAFSFHPLFIGGDPFRVTSMYILVSHLEKAFGVHYAMGGVQALARAMADVVTSQGGALRFGAEVDEILLTGDGKHARTTGVQLAGGEVVAADIVVSNADAGHTYDRLLRRQGKRRWSRARLRRSRWSMGLFVWYFGTRGTRGLWRDVGHHTVLNGPRYHGLVDDIFIKGELAEDMSLYVHRPSVTDPSCAPEDGDTFYALSPVPHLGHRGRGPDWTEIAESYRARVQSVLEDQLLPGLGDHLTASEVFTPETFRDRYLSPHGSGFSIEPRIFQSAWFRPHNISEEARGLFLVGAGTHPGAGLPGVVASAEVLAKLVPDVNPVRLPLSGAQKMAAE